MAESIFRNVSNVTPETTNGYRAFLVPPDGSKEGWDESERGDERRAQFVKWLRSYSYSDGSSPLDWIEVQFGGDDDDANIINHNHDGPGTPGNLA